MLLTCGWLSPGPAAFSLIVQVIPQYVIMSFDFQELELILGGLPIIDVEDWRNNTVYIGGFTPKHNVGACIDARCFVVIASHGNGTAYIGRTVVLGMRRYNVPGAEGQTFAICNWCRDCAGHWIRWCV